MKQLPTSHVQLCNMLHACIDLSAYDEGALLKNIIRSEKNVENVTVEVVEDWLRGLPSACTIPFTNSEIREILDSCGNGHWTIDNYWRFAAGRIKEFASFPYLYA